MSGSIAATGRRGGEGAKDAGVGAGVADHGALTGLEDNDHPQYALAADLAALDHGALTGLLDNDHPQYQLTGYKATLTVGAGGASSLVFAGLDGNTHKRYRIRGSGPNAGGANLTISVNGTVCSYSTFYQATAAALSVSSAFAGTSYADSIINFEGIFDVGVTTPNRYRAFQFRAWVINDAGVQMIHAYSLVRWPNRTDNITSIAIEASIASAFSQGFVATIEQVVV